MRKLEIADADGVRLAIQHEIGRSKDARYDHRLHGLLLVCNGYSCTQVAKMFGEERRTVQRWVKRLAAYGIDGLREGERAGRPSRMDAKQWDKIGRDLRSAPREFGFAQAMWEGDVLREHLRRHYKVRLGLRQCQRLLGQMGSRLRKPRLIVGQVGPAVRRASKKAASNRARLRR